MAKVPLNSKKATQKQIDEGLALLQKKQVRDAKIASGEIKGNKSYADMTPEEKTKRQDYNKRRRVRLQLISNKALEAGITVTDAEVDEYIASGV